METLDDLIKVKQLVQTPEFQRAEKLYDARVDRLRTRMMLLDTSDEETLRLKTAIYYLVKNHPRKILEGEAKAIESRLEKAQRELSIANTK